MGMAGMGGVAFPYPSPPPSVEPDSRLMLCHSFLNHFTLLVALFIIVDL